MTIGERIAKCRKEKNLSQEYIAELLEVSRQAVSKWENDVSAPDTNNLIKLANVFGVSVEYLANGNEDESPKIVYVEKNISILKWIGIVLIAMGGLSCVLSIMYSPMLPLGIACFVFGTILLLFQKTGLLLGLSMLCLGTVLFIIQGFTGGIDTPVLCLILALSIGIPLLVFVFIKIIHYFKTHSLKEVFCFTPKTLRIFIALLILVILIVVTILFCVQMVRSKRDNIYERANWLSQEVLSSCLLDDFPVPRANEFLRLEENSVLLYLDKNDYDNYLTSVYSYLNRCAFRHLGTKGEVLEYEDSTITYEILRWNNLSGYASKTDKNDYIFVYSNSETSLNGEIDCFVLRFDFMSAQNVRIGNSNFTYNLKISVQRETQDENYKYRSYSIQYLPENSPLFIGDFPTDVQEGKEITISIAEDGNERILRMNGEILKKSFSTDDYSRYTFRMPPHNVIIELASPDDELIVPPSLKTVSDLNDWMKVTSADMVVELSTREMAKSEKYFNYVKRTKQVSIIEELFFRYQNLSLDQVNIDNLDFNNAHHLTVNFVLKDGTCRSIEFINGFYMENEQSFYAVEVVPTLNSYGTFDGLEVVDTFSLATSENSYRVYNRNNEEVSDIRDVSLIEFVNYSGSLSYPYNEYLYYIDTEIGRIYVMSDTVFRFSGENVEPLYCLELTNTTFSELTTLNFSTTNS